MLGFQKFNEARKLKKLPDGNWDLGPFDIALEMTDSFKFKDDVKYMLDELDLVSYGVYESYCVVLCDNQNQPIRVITCHVEENEEINEKDRDKLLQYVAWPSNNRDQTYKIYHSVSLMIKFDSSDLDLDEGESKFIQLSEINYLLKSKNDITNLLSSFLRIKKIDSNIIIYSHNGASLDDQIDVIFT